jgi:hypothetical protein
VKYSAKVVLSAPRFSLSFGKVDRPVLLNTAPIFIGRRGEMGPPGEFTDKDFVTQPEADTDLQTA